MKIFSFCLLFLLFSSCNNSKDRQIEDSFFETSVQKKDEVVVVKLDENLTLEDLLKQKKYKSLNIDSDFKKYVEEYSEESSSLLEKTSIMIIDANSEINILGEKVNTKTNEDDPMESLDKLKGLFSLAGKAGKGVLKSVGNTYTLIKLEKEREKLFSGFSKEKKKKAIEFEKEMNKILDYSYTYIANDKVNKNDILQNYKSLQESIKSDEQIKNELERLGEMVDDFYKTNAKVKEILALNKVINQTDYSSVVKYGNYLLENKSKDIEIKIEPYFLEEYFSKMNEILNEINNPNFDTPIEDWSEEKQENVKFIYDDIKTRLSKEINSLDYNL